MDIRCRVGKYDAHPGQVNRTDILNIEFGMEHERRLAQFFGGEMQVDFNINNDLVVLTAAPLGGQTLGVKRRDGVPVALQVQITDAQCNHLSRVRPAFGLTTVNFRFDATDSRLIIELPEESRRQPPKKFNRRGQVNRLAVVKAAMAEAPLLHQTAAAAILSADADRAAGRPPRQHVMLQDGALTAVPMALDQELVGCEPLPPARPLNWERITEWVANSLPQPAVAAIGDGGTGEVIMTLNGATFAGDAPVEAIAKFIATYNLRA